MAYPTYERAQAQTQEGFFGGVARGAGHPDCLRTLNDGAELLGIVMTPDTTNQPDFVEFQVLLSKLGCLKKDLMSPSGIVEGTRYQPYETALDREPVAEVAATCLNRTIPKRDLDIIFETWKARGNILLKRLCTLAELTEAQVVHCEQLFANSWIDVYDVALGRCIPTARTMPGPMSPTTSRTSASTMATFQGGQGAMSSVIAEAMYSTVKNIITPPP